MIPLYDRKGPRSDVRLLGGARGSDVPCISQTCVPDFGMEGWQACDAGVDLVLLRARDMVAKIQMKLLEICRNR